MKLSEIVLLEDAIDWELYRKFIIMAWGRLLYMNYDHLPKEGYGSTLDDEFVAGMKKYVEASESERENELDEWVGDGMPIQDDDKRTWATGRPMLGKKEVDTLLRMAEKRTTEDLTLYRVSGDHKLRPGSWVSTISVDDDARYTGPNKAGLKDRKAYHLPAGAQVIFTHGWADKDEVIVSTDELLSYEKEA